MPTGYTASVCDGRTTEFPDFAMQCARAFGALISMRDDAADATIPEEFAPSTYHAGRYAEIKARLSELESMTPEQAQVASLAAYEKRLADANKWNTERDAENDRLKAMREKVLAWQPPTPEHVELKSFMIEQLTISLSDYKTDLPSRQSGPEWLAAQTAEAQSSLDYHAKEQKAENERARGRTQWLKALRQSLASTVREA